MRIRDAPGIEDQKEQDERQRVPRKQALTVYIMPGFSAHDGQVKYG
jgi:hypothetical protein